MAQIGIRELNIETFSGRRQLQPDVTLWFLRYCACSCSSPCCRGPVGDVKLACLVLWRKREYLTFISIRFVAFSNQNFADYRSWMVLVFFVSISSSIFFLSRMLRSIYKLCYLNLHLYNFSVSCHRVKIQHGKQQTVSELYMDKIVLRAK